MATDERCSCEPWEFGPFWRLIYPGRTRWVYHRKCGKLSYVERAKRPLRAQ